MLEEIGPNPNGSERNNTNSMDERIYRPSLDAKFQSGVRFGVSCFSRRGSPSRLVVRPTKHEPEWAQQRVADEAHSLAAAPFRPCQNFDTAIQVSHQHSWGAPENTDHLRHPLKRDGHLRKI